MKPPRKRLAILHQPEIQDLFGPPRLIFEEKRFYFTLNDLELKSFQSIRDRQQRCYFVVLLGYIDDDSDRSTAEATDLGVYAKDAFKTLLPRA